MTHSIESNLILGNLPNQEEILDIVEKNSYITDPKFGFLFGKKLENTGKMISEHFKQQCIDSIEGSNEDFLDHKFIKRVSFEYEYELDSRMKELETVIDKYKTEIKALNETLKNIKKEQVDEGKAIIKEEKINLAIKS